MLTGGEPFQRMDLEKIVQGITLLGINVDIVTNATLLDEKQIERISRSGLVEVTTSIDGPENIHNLIRGHNGAFSKTTGAISLLRIKNIKVDVVCVLNSYNKDYIPEITDICDKLGVSSLTFSNLICGDMGEKKYNALKLNPHSIEKVIDEISQQRKKYSSLPMRTVGFSTRERQNICKLTDIVAINGEGLVTRCLLADKRSQGFPVTAGFRKGVEQLGDSCRCAIGVFSDGN